MRFTIRPSITKILTALIVIEHCNLDDVVTFSHDAIYSVDREAAAQVWM